MAETPKLRHSTSYRARRAAEYPGMGDQLDAILDGLRAYRDGKPLPPKTLAILDACEAVKTRFKKPPTP